MQVLIGPTRESEWEWFEYGEHPDGRKVEFEIRAIPDSVLSAIDQRYNGKHQKLTYKDGARIANFEHERERNIVIDQAAYALGNARTLYSKMDGAEDATTYSKLLGRTIADGETVCLDDSLRSNLPLREEFLRAVSQKTDIPRWIIARSESLKIKGKEAEASLKS